MSSHESDRENNSENESENEKKTIPVYRKRLLEALQSVKHLSNYAYGESLKKFYLPHLRVPGIGLLSYPLCEYQAKAIIAQCKQAPFGRGEETIIDTTVRNTWQLSPTEFTIENQCEWDEFASELVEKACIELGFTDAIIEKKLYKLLVYEQGGFFRPHKDTEKEKGMFASLIIILPSDYKGGQLIIQHNDTEKKFDFGGSKSSFTVSFAAFYADCEHEVHTITQGYRLCLVYNIINIGQDPAPLPIDNTTLVKQIADNFQLWESDPNGSIKLIYLLEHEYTDVGLSFHNLKGRDRVVAQLMKQVQSYIDAMMVLANFKWDYNCNVHEDENEYDFTKMTLAPIININDSKFVDEGLGIFIQDQVLNEEQFISRRPQQAHYKPTGNDGVEIDCQYQATGLVFCPKKYSSTMKYDLMGTELSITELVKMSEAEVTHEQALALLKSTVLKPMLDQGGINDVLGSNWNTELLVRLLTFLREHHLVNEYLYAQNHIIICIFPHPDLSSELIRGCSELGWTELASAIRKYVDKYIVSGYMYYNRMHITESMIQYLHSLAFSPIPNDNQQEQIRSELLDYILEKIDGQIKIGKRHGSHYNSWPILIECIHRLGRHSMIKDYIEKFIQEMPYDYTFSKAIIKAINECQSCDSFEASIQPSLVILIRITISHLNHQVSRICQFDNWKNSLRCKCKDCEKIKAFAYNLTAQKEQFTLNCDSWERDINSWAEVEVLPDAVERDDNPVIKKKKTERTFLLTKLPLTTTDKESEQVLETVNYLQSLPYCH